FDARAFIAGLESRGVKLEGEGENLHAWPASRLTEEDRATFRRHKREVLAALPKNGRNGNNGKTASGGRGCPGWDQAEANRRLAALRAEGERVGRGDFGGDPPAVFRTLAADLVAIGEGYIQHHDLEAARGWDALELLRGLRQLLLQTVGRLKH